jgi:hypothetical protein
MKVWKIVNVCVTVIILLAIILPFSVIDGNSETKPAFDYLGVGTKANKWLDENVDLRKSTSRKIKYHLTHLSPSDSVYIGKDEWLFYALNGNLEIARGAFPLDQTTLDFQADTFSNAKRYYDRMGADFYFMTYPAKSSIYPEYIWDATLTDHASSTSDIITSNLDTRTDVKTINPREALIEAKADDKVFLKLDVHANDYGGYIVYKTICKEIAEKSGIAMTPTEVQFTEGEYPVGFNGIADAGDLFGKAEPGPVAIFEAKAHRVTEGELFDEIEKICADEKYADDLLDSRVIFENPDAPNGTLLIYGTSMFECDSMGERWQLVRYLSENFKRVVYMGIYTGIIPEIDAVVKPDIVIVEDPERYSNIAGYRDTPYVPIIEDSTDNVVK